MRRFIPFFAAIFVRVLHATLRVQHVNSENVTTVPQYILAFWHAHLLLMLHSRFRQPITVMSSRSKDGDISAGVFKLYRINCVRGSSSRGGSAAVRELIRVARSGSNIVFTPDGPTGPARVAKDGVVYAARVTGLPIVPVAFAARKKKLLGSWDRMVVPLPFTKVVFLYGEALTVTRDEDVEAARLRVERVMNELAEKAEAYVS